MDKKNRNIENKNKLITHADLFENVVNSSYHASLHKNMLSHSKKIK